ncbi:MAG: Hint domain-containing protein [Pseudomonadota bacterium]|nr:Hint domain-containing protein [Pseudomonadota bacterium]
MAIGEAGSITTNSPTENAPITVTLEEPLTNPVFAFTATNNGGDQFTIRLTDQVLDGDGNTTSFSFIIEEWEYHDGPHPAVETINWLAIEAGVHTLPDGRVIEAGTTATDALGSSASFSGSFTDPPVVLTSVMSNNDTTTVDSDPLNITSSGFDLSLQEEEAQADDHGTETIGWIAIQAGGDGSAGTANTFGGFDNNVDTFGLGATFTDAVVLGETQTINGPNPATVVIDSQNNSSVDMFLEEEASQDDELNHIDETLGLVAFEDGLIPCFTHGTLIRTQAGEEEVQHLQKGQLLPLWSEGAARVRLVLQRHLSAKDLAAYPNLRPVKITAGALGQGLPKRDLWVSPQHRMLVASPVAKRMFGAAEVLVAAIRLTELPGIYVDEWVDCITYVHVVMDQHQVIIAEGSPSETLFTGPEALRAMTPAAREELFQLFPDLAIRRGLPDPARPIPKGKQQKRLVARLQKNAKRPLDQKVLQLQK